MKIDHARSLTLPANSAGTGELSCSNSVLFIGANGSGKTRLGTWVEFSSPQKDRVHRISAQKSLTMPDDSALMSIERAEKSLLFGNPNSVPSDHLHYKQHLKFENKPAVFLLHDYQKLMTYLFSEHIERSAEYLAASKASTAKVKPPVTKLDQVKAVWEKILPYRELILGGVRIQTRVKGNADQTYSSSEMSDGERVIFYLIGQCLAAPKDGIIVVDEPQLHLHKSIQIPLWSSIEELRSDCLFVYLTHDVDFASAQQDATRIWLKAFDGDTWDWELIQKDEALPDALLLEVLGSRKPVVFVEGENGSYDVSLYREILQDFLVIPRGSCVQVIQSVKAFKVSKQLHHLEVYGIVDRDRRVPAEIASLESASVFVLDVAEVENLFCTQEILQIVSKRLVRDEDSDFQSVSNAIFSQLQAELLTQTSLRVASEVNFLLNNFDENAKGEAALSAALQTLVGGINVSQIYRDISDEFNDVVSRRDYKKLLQIYNRKSLPTQISGAFGLKNGGLSEFVVRLAKSDSRDVVALALRGYFGRFAPHIKMVTAPNPPETTEPTIAVANQSD